MEGENPLHKAVLGLLHVHCVMWCTLTHNKQMPKRSKGLLQCPVWLELKHSALGSSLPPIHHLVLGQLPTSKHLYSDCKKEAVTPTQPVQVNVLSPRWDPGSQNIPQIALCSPFLWSIFPDLKCKANLNYTRHCISKEKWWSGVLGGGGSAVETSGYWMLFQRPWWVLSTYIMAHHNL